MRNENLRAGERYVMFCICFAFTVYLCGSLCFLCLLVSSNKVLFCRCSLGCWNVATFVSCLLGCTFYLFCMF